MNRRMELLAPGGDLDSIKAAIVGGADAIYCGLDKFNARHRAANITFDDLGGVLALAHRHDCRVFLTLNIMMVESDIPVLTALLNRLANTSIDGVIVQDLGLLHLLSTCYPGLRVHASTQLTTHNEGQIKFLGRLGAARVNLSRELSLGEIRPLVAAAHGENISAEVFVHGSYCISFSGICYMSSVHGGNSGNRGRCSQPCRDRYVTTRAGRDFPLNLKDNSAYFDLERLADAGVDALKIEGRMKTYHYVYTVTNTYRKKLQALYQGDSSVDDSADLYRVFNRDFSNAYLAGDMGRDMFSDHPRNRSAAHLRESALGPDGGHGPRASDEAYDLIADFKAEIRTTIDQVSAEKAPLTVSVAGRPGAPLTVTVRAPRSSFVVKSESLLALQREDSTVPPLDAGRVMERLKAVNDTEYTIDRLELDDLQPGLFVPTRELNQIRKKILFTLNGSKEPIAAAGVPAFVRRGEAAVTPALSVLIAAVEDAALCDETRADIYFQLPGALGDRAPKLIELFTKNRRLVPWFPAILIGEDHAAAVRFLRQVRPGRIVTNNTGVAHEAWREGIPWIAGPGLNAANSIGMASLKENFDCLGAVVSSELSESQIRRIDPPADFELHYSLYHPVLLLTSRQCLFHQVTGCEKDTVDDECLGRCEQASTITNLRGDPLFIKKTSGNHCRIYHRTHFLNTEVVADLPGLFSSFFIDLRDVETETRTALDKPGLVRLFEDHLRGGGSSPDPGSVISPTTHTLYRKGV